MTPEHVEAARRELNTWRNGDVMSVFGEGTFVEVETVVRKLDRAGLLRTGLEKRAVEAWEGYAKDPFCQDAGTFESCNYTKQGLAVGKESLALKQPPRPRWTREGSILRRGGDAVYTIGFPDATSADVAMLAMNRALNACDTEPTNA